MITLNIVVDVDRIRTAARTHNMINITQSEFSRIFTVICGNVLDDHMSLVISELRELRSNPKTYGRAEP
jgi:hypothetical protein